MSIYTLFAGASPNLAWQFQRAVTIVSTPSNDFQVRVALTAANFDYSKCKADGSDIRFQSTAASNPAVSTLTYWNESWNYGGTSVFWIKVPTSTTTTIYLRYGNAPSAVAVSSFVNTMEANVMRFRYYGGTNFDTFDVGGSCALPSVDWGSSAAVTLCGNGTRGDSLSWIMDGFLTPSGNGDYTFFGTSDDGQRLYVNQQFLINNWQEQGPTEYSATFSWTDGLPKKYEYQYFENGGGAVARCGWTPPGGAKVYPIPASNQYSPKFGTGYMDTFNMSGTVGSETTIFAYA